MLILDFVIAILCAGVAAGSALLWLSRGKTRVEAPGAPSQSVAFLFEDLDLVHATPNAELLMMRDDTASDWQALWRGLSIRFPGLPDENSVHDTNQLTVAAINETDRSALHIEREGDAIRVTIDDRSDTDQADHHQIMALEAEASVLRPAAMSAPYPIWLQRPDGSVRWSNHVYDKLTEPLSTGGAKAVFAPADMPVEAGQTKRTALRRADDDNTKWFDVHATQIGDDTLYHATNVDAVMRAEAAQRNFVQTLAKTFAQLSIGLAIFDRDGQLALFNPALMDLTSLPPGFLSARPDLLTFFDRLRDNRVMPEPKNYRSWRQDITDFIAAANQGSYQETWTLDTGHTYRVSGRPHPDGAVAFLIEDITAEISLTRNFRAELELGQSMMDTFEDALVVFSSAGVVTFCNAAYRTLWKLDPDSSFADVTIIDSIKSWQADCAPDPAWGDIRDFVHKMTDRAPWDASLNHLVYGPFSVHLSPIASGATVIRFSGLTLLPEQTEKATTEA